MTAAGTSCEGGTLLLEAQSTGIFGQLVGAGRAEPDKVTLNLYAPQWTPACGTTVTEFSADTMLSGFAAVVADDLAPGAETWQPESTATSTGATLSCS